MTTRPSVRPTIRPSHRPLIAQASVDTPLGRVRLAATPRGLAGLWFDGQAHHPGPLDAPEDATQSHIALALRDLQAYWIDGQHTFGVPLDAAGTAFQQAVWSALRQIPPGQTLSYGEVAQRIGRPAAVRAVGAAIGRNPLSIITPCHRVVGRDGTLTGYAGGLHRKRALLAAEGALRTTPPAPGQASAGLGQRSTLAPSRLPA